MQVIRTWFGRRCIGWGCMQTALLLGWVGILMAVDVRSDPLGEALDLERTGDVTGSLAMAERALRGQEYDEDWHLLRMRGFLGLGQYGEAYGALTNSLERLPRSIRIRWLGQEALRFTGRTDEAVRVVDEILALAESRPWSYRDARDRVVVGRAALLRGADPKLVLDRLYEPAKALDGKVLDPYLAMGELALEKHDFALAAKVFQEGLNEIPDHPELWWGVARAYGPSDGLRMATAIEEALEVNPRHAGSLLLLVDRLLDAEDYGEASRRLQEVRSVNPYHPEAWAYEAVLAHLQGQSNREVLAMEMALRHWPTNPRVPYLVGRKLSRNYRFAEGARLQRQSLEFDPGYRPARSQLAEDLLRLGEENEGWQLAAEVHEADGYNVMALNLVTLRDVLDEYRTLTNAHFQLRMEPHEAEVYGQRALALLERARVTLAAKYGVELETPVLVEMYEEQKDFAVRTFGMPVNHGYLGVCFGRVVTANSPVSRPGLTFNWEAMLYHEFCHVVTLQLSRNKMPRWLSEGISVYEERQAHSAWGERWKPEYLARVLGDGLTPIAELSGAFLAPPSPEYLQFAYFQSSLVVEYLVERFGHERLHAILRELGEGVGINEVLERHAQPMAELEEGFAVYAQAQATKVGGGMDWEKPPLEALGERDAGRAWRDWAATRAENGWVILREARRYLDQGQWDQARPIIEQLVARCPDLAGNPSPWGLLARLRDEAGDEPGVLQALREWARRDDSALEPSVRLMEAGSALSDWDLVREQAERHLAVDPLVPLPYRHLARAAEALADAEAAMGAYRVLLLMDPANPADYRFRLARLLHERGETEAKAQLLRSLEEAPRHRAALELLLRMEGG